MRKGIEDLLSRNRVELVKGKARLVSATAIEVSTGSGARLVRTRSVIVASGSRWAMLPGIEADGRTVLTSDDVLELGHLGGSMAIVGGGAVGCEIAEIYSALGTKVTIVEMMDHVLPAEDAEIARRLEAALKRKGIGVMTAKRVEAVRRTGSGAAEVALEGGPTLTADRVLVGVGRRPNLEDLGLEEAGVSFDRRGIAVDARLQTNVGGVYAVGDVAGKALLAHAAMAQGIAAAENARGGSSEIDYQTVPRCIYTDPEVAAVGVTEAEAVGTVSRPHVYRLRLGHIGRAMTMGETFGFAKMICDGPGGRIVGFHALAPHASELIAEVVLAMKHRLTAEDLSRVIHPHPTLSELVWEAASGAAGKPIHGD
jgi:dihydrolipoamide dehydrogenase